MAETMGSLPLKPFVTAHLEWPPAPPQNSRESRSPEERVVFYKSINRKDGFYSNKRAALWPNKPNQFFTKIENRASKRSSTISVKRFTRRHPRCPGNCPETAFNETKANDFHPEPYDAFPLLLFQRGLKKNVLVINNLTYLYHLLTRRYLLC